MNKSIEARMERIDKQLKALREEINKDLALPRPPLMRVGCGCGTPCGLCGSGMKAKGPFGLLFGVFKGCLQPECDNYWGKK